MANKECTICKHYGEQTIEPNKLEAVVIYDEYGNPVNLQMCRKHSVELFKMGQKNFLISHFKILVDVIASDEMRFLEILENVIRENHSKIY